jgi:hypothetical protein
LKIARRREQLKQTQGRLSCNGNPCAAIQRRRVAAVRPHRHLVPAPRQHFETSC